MSVVIVIVIVSANLEFDSQMVPAMCQEATVCEKIGPFFFVFCLFL